MMDYKYEEQRPASLSHCGETLRSPKHPTLNDFNGSCFKEISSRLEDLLEVIPGYLPSQRVGASSPGKNCRVSKVGLRSDDAVQSETAVAPTEIIAWVGNCLENCCPVVSGVRFYLVRHG
ncbi:Hypothetical predicted protein [Xyrichtys novacula]|uniref:Uncharacterized protein n=1 Tax=Xyrichtys novacula TaxID=13765 RepID=A0AAV1EHR7_XYRNO|nr:Hypothetical predicted protein [Xyrichtys novacula]